MKKKGGTPVKLCDSKISGPKHKVPADCDECPLSVKKKCSTYKMYLKINK